MRAIICGANGAMGKLIQSRLEGNIAGLVSLDGENNVPKSFEELNGVTGDVVLDFSQHSAVLDVLSYAKKNGCGVVIGTTGHTESEKAAIYEAAKEIPVFYSGNMSLGIAVLCRLAKEAVSCFPDADIEIVETHHNRKVDAPSGTAWMLFDAIRQVRPEATAICGRAGEGKRAKSEVGICSIRRGNVVGIHEVIITTENQSLTLRHDAGDRGMFADGALRAARFIQGKPAGLYTMNELLGG